MKFSKVRNSPSQVVSALSTLKINSALDGRPH